MLIPPEMLEELNILMMFDLTTTLAGIKVHSNATPEAIAAAERLFNKGLLTQVDGGYLTTLGHEAAQHAQSAIQLLRAG